MRWECKISMSNWHSSSTCSVRTFSYSGKARDMFIWFMTESDTADVHKLLYRVYACDRQQCACSKLNSWRVLCGPPTGRLHALRIALRSLVRSSVRPSIGLRPGLQLKNSMTFFFIFLTMMTKSPRADRRGCTQQTFMTYHCRLSCYRQHCAKRKPAGI